MNQLPIFVNIRGRPIILIGEGEAADAKRRLIERAGGICVGADDRAANIAFIAVADIESALTQAEQLRARGVLVNVVDQPDHCDFTTPAIIDRDPVLIAIGTGGASAGLAKALRQRLETLLPQNLGALAQALFQARTRITARWSNAADRRRQIDAALSPAAPLDPFKEFSPEALDAWLDGASTATQSGHFTFTLSSLDPEDLTLRIARMLGEADHIFYDPAIPASILNRARADAARHSGPPTDPLPAGLSITLLLPVSAQ